MNASILEQSTARARGRRGQRAGEATDGAQVAARGWGGRGVRWRQRPRVVESLQLGADAAGAARIAHTRATVVVTAYKLEPPPRR